MRVAFASESQEQSKLFEKYVRDYFADRGSHAEVSAFADPDKMLDSLSSGTYDVVFLNIIYGRRSGIDYVYRLRAFNPDIAVVVLRVTDAGKIECIVTAPMLIVLDDFSEKSFAAMMDTVYGSINTRPDQRIVISTSKDMSRVVSVTSIVYAEVTDHRVMICLSSGETIETNRPMKELAGKLGQYSEFLFPHRSFIVNAFYVSCITPDKVYLRTTGTEVPIARGKFKEFFRAYESYFRAYNRNISAGE